jgi:SSS family solute:Na+ symporter
MTGAPHWTALIIFAAVLLLVTVAGFVASRWHGGFGRRKAPDGVSLASISLASLDEWGLGGRRFGTLVTWFLMGGDTYTAYTVIAVPALVYGVGGYGFFAVPYCIMGYPLMLIVMPRFWQVCRENGYVTLADFIRGRLDSRWLAVAFALTGLLATMPYIALQLVGMQVALSALGLTGEWPLIAAFVVLAAYTYTSGLRAPALIAIVKDVMLYVMVIAAVVVVPIKLGGYGHVFQLAGVALATHHPAGSLLIGQERYWAYSTLALGSTLALMLYPHTVTGILASGSERVIQRNAALLPAYNVLLGLVALLGYMALAAGIESKSPNMVVPLLFVKLFPEWFAAFCLAAIAVSALVPAAIMSIAAANLVTRNLMGEFRKGQSSSAQEAATAKVVSLLVKFGALAFVLGVPSMYAIQLQLLGGIWILQLLPGFLSGLYGWRLRTPALLAGWATGMLLGSGMAWSLQLKSSIYALHVLGHTYAVYAALPAVLANLAVVGVWTVVGGATGGSKANAGLSTSSR